MNSTSKKNRPSLFGRPGSGCLTVSMAVLAAWAPVASAATALQRVVPPAGHTWRGTTGPFPSAPAAHADVCGWWNLKVGNLVKIDDGLVAQMECLDDMGQPTVNGVIISDGICPADTGTGQFNTASGWGSTNLGCVSGTKNEGPPKCDDARGNPIHVGTGNKFQAEPDYLGAGKSPLQFTRYYNSEDAIVFGGVTKDTPIWRHTYLRSIVVNTIPREGRIAMARRPDGKHVLFTDPARQHAWSPDEDEADQLLETVDGEGNTTGFTFVDVATGDRDSFDGDGQLLLIRHKSGVIERLAYSIENPTLMLSVTNSFGRTLTFEHRPDGLLKKMIDPGRGEYVYDYDASGRLVSVTYPDLKQRQYLYNEPGNMFNSLPNALTGIVDENGARFATWKYDGAKRAYSSEHGQGVEKVILSFGGTGATVVTEGARVSNVRSTARYGRYLNMGSDQPAGAGCSAASNAKEYDAFNNLVKSTDFNGGIKTFTYDLARKLETSRIEAFGTPDSRTISTEWHPQFHSQTKIAEPLRVTSMTYSSSELLATESIQTTSDTNGSQGFAAALVGLPRKIEYTYTDFGQLKTVKGARTDVEELTVYEYDSQGNLASVRNPAGQFVTYSNYDAHGRPGKVTDQNGIGTEYGYSARGWIESQTLRGSSVQV